MDRLRLPPTVGLVGGLLAALFVVAPYALPDATAVEVNDYYGYGLAGPWLVLICGLLAVVVFASGREERTEHDTVAGAGLALGIAMVLFGLFWSVSVPFESIRPVTANWWFEYHRWTVVGSSLIVPIAGAWYARELELF